MLTLMERRDFLKAAPAVTAAPAVLAQRGANDRMGVAMLGVGTRGIYLLELAQECPNTEIRTICDLYDANLQRAAKKAFNKKATLTKEWEKVVESKDIDAVVIATPDFWHAPMAIRAAQAGKHIYVEKGLCRTLEEAKGIRKAVRDNKVTLQLGHDANSAAANVKARELFQSGRLGKTCVARTYIDRTNPYPEWQFYTEYGIQTPPADATAQSIDWERFQAGASVKTAFDRERFFRWRCWWEYGTGIAGDLMSHQWDGLNGIMDLGIPHAVQTMGGLLFWKQDREVPDAWHAYFEYPKRDLQVTFACTFHNNHHGTISYIFGRDATLELAGNRCEVFDAQWRPDVRQRPAAERAKPSYSMQRNELEVSNHVRNWVDCIRSGQVPRCGMDRAYDEAVVIVMSIEAYVRERKVKWDPVSEQIV